MVAKKEKTRSKTETPVLDETVTPEVQPSPKRMISVTVCFGDSCKVFDGVSDLRRPTDRSPILSFVFNGARFTTTMPFCIEETV